MKNLLICFCLVILACNKKITKPVIISEPIVDYNQSYESNDNLLKLKSSMKKEEEQTIVLLKNRLINFDQFYRLLNKRKVKTVKTITDSSKISELGYSYNNVKKIIIVHKK